VNVHLTGRASGRQGDGTEVWEQSENMQLALGSIPLLFSLDPLLRPSSPAIRSAAPLVWMARFFHRGTAYPQAIGDLILELVRTLRDLKVALPQR
jgi:hypothetical protein